MICFYTQMRDVLIVEDMNKYIMFSDAYRSLSKIFYNGEFYDIVEIITDNELSDKLKVELIKKTLEA